MSMFDKLTKAGLTGEFSKGGSAIQDQELDGRPFGRPWGVELMVFGVSRRLIEGGPSPDPMEVWHGFTEGRQGTITPRTVRGRAELRSMLLFQAVDGGLAFLNPETGDVCQEPTGEGKWILVSASNMSKALMFCRVGLDFTRGRLAGKGRSTAYSVESKGVAIAQARAAYPELVALPMDAMLSLPLEDEAQITDSGRGERPEAGVLSDDGTGFERELETTATPVTAPATTKRRR